MSLPKRTVESQPRTVRSPNIARTLAWAQQQLAEQNDALRESLEDAPDFAQVLAVACPRRAPAPASRAHVWSHPQRRA
ncbi:MAG: hypothetical protein WCJ30_06910 [Deltaproteobacteria bacterium]